MFDGFSVERMYSTKVCTGKMCYSVVGGGGDDNGDDGDDDYDFQICRKLF